MVAHFARGGALNSPWGIAFAPAGFGRFAGDVFIGNFGGGRVNVFTRFGLFLGQLHNQTGQPITINGLWGLLLGNTAFGGAGSLAFSAGPNDENDGLLGTLASVSIANHLSRRRLSRRQRRVRSAGEAGRTCSRFE